MADLDIEAFRNSDFLVSQCIKDFMSLIELEESNSPQLKEFEVNTKSQKS